MSVPKYDIIVMDPPWHYSASVKMHEQVGKLYKTMKLKPMMEIPVHKMCKPSTILFMWTTGPKMNEAIKLMNAWGFTYKTVAYVWKKGTHKNMGRYSMSQCEYVLAATRKGKQMKPVVWNEPQFIDVQGTGHSSKPEVVQDKIERTWGQDKSCCEVFARRFRKGWDCIGNEINGTLEDFLEGEKLKLR